MICPATYPRGYFLECTRLRCARTNLAKVSGVKVPDGATSSHAFSRFFRLCARSRLPPFPLSAHSLLISHASLLFACTFLATTDCSFGESVDQLPLANSERISESPSRILIVRQPAQEPCEADARSSSMQDRSSRRFRKALKSLVSSPLCVFPRGTLIRSCLIGGRIRRMFSTSFKVKSQTIFIHREEVYGRMSHKGERNCDETEFSCVL